MEFPFNINNLFGDVISLVDKRLLPFNRTPDLYKEHRSQLMKVLDKMGEASAKAQGLHGPITSGRKLEHSDHRVYVMKDTEINGTKGAVVGFIKVGHKKLFVYDHNGCQHELDPLCVLDFYVHESRQRKGCGKRLFQHMLQCEMIKPPHLAIDRPSNMFLGFLQKHYGLRNVIPQVNNFVVFDGFFRSRTEQDSRNLRQGSAGRPPVFPYKRAAAPHNGVYDPVERHRRPPYPPATNRPPSGRKDNTHIDNSNVPQNILASNKDIIVRPPSAGKACRTGEKSQNENQNITAIENLHLNLNSITGRNNSTVGGINRYSRHGRRSVTPSSRLNSANRSRQNSGQQEHHNATAHGVPITLQNGQGSEKLKRESSPPLLKRNVTPVNHYMDRDGHLKVTPQSKPTSLPVLKPVPVTEASHSKPALDGFPRSLTDNTTWTVFGVIPSGYQHRQFTQKKYHHTRLW